MLTYFALFIFETLLKMLEVNTIDLQAEPSTLQYI